MIEELPPSLKVSFALLLLLAVNSQTSTNTNIANLHSTITRSYVTSPRMTIQSSLQCAVSSEFGSTRCVQVRIHLKQIGIAVVNPVFTTAAYSSFYTFYRAYANATDGLRIQNGTSLLTAIVNNYSWGRSYGLYYFIESNVAKHGGVVVGNNTSILTDIDVNDGKLFYANRTRRYDVVILGFTEYVTANEYSYYKRFVETGGRLIILSACNFIAEVSYDPTTNTVRLVKGHGWEFDGKVAQKGPFHRWYIENTNWVGSNYALFYPEGYQINGALTKTTHPLGLLMTQIFEKNTFFTSYMPHEENIITNSSAIPIAIWQLSRMNHHDWIVATYEHDYQKGMVIHTGIFGTDIISTNSELQFLVLAAIGVSSFVRSDFAIRSIPSESLIQVDSPTARQPSAPPLASELQAAVSNEKCEEDAERRRLYEVNHTIDNGWAL